MCCLSLSNASGRTKHVVCPMRRISQDGDMIDHSMNPPIINPIFCQPTVISDSKDIVLQPHQGYRITVVGVNAIGAHELPIHTEKLPTLFDSVSTGGIAASLDNSTEIPRPRAPPTGLQVALSDRSAGARSHILRRQRARVVAFLSLAPGSTSLLLQWPRYVPLRHAAPAGEQRYPGHGHPQRASPGPVSGRILS